MGEYAAAPMWLLIPDSLVYMYRIFGALLFLMKLSYSSFALSWGALVMWVVVFVREPPWRVDVLVDFLHGPCDVLRVLFNKVF